MDALRQVDGWPCEHVAVAVAGAVEAEHGDVDRIFKWASVTKLATAVAVLVASASVSAAIRAGASSSRATVSKSRSFPSTPKAGEPASAKPQMCSKYSANGISAHSPTSAAASSKPVFE